jgi:hypothetical protein
MMLRQPCPRCGGKLYSQGADNGYSESAANGLEAKCFQCGRIFALKQAVAVSATTKPEAPPDLPLTPEEAADRLPPFVSIQRMADFLRSAAR